MAIQEIVLLMRNTNPLIEVRNVWYAGDLETEFADVVVCYNALREWYENYFATFLPVTWVLYGATARDVSSPGMPALPMPHPSDITGTIGLTIGIGQAAAVINMRGPTARPNRARKFIGPLSEQAVTNGVLDAGATNALGDWVPEFNNWQAMHATDGTAFLSARWDRAAGRVVSANALSQASYSNVPGALRSRKPGVGI